MEYLTVSEQSIMEFRDFEHELEEKAAREIEDDKPRFDKTKEK